MKEVAPLAPSDLGSVALGERCRVSGRIASREDASTLILADAKARVRVALAAPSEIARGDLAIVAGVVGPRGLLDARIAERIEPMRAIRREISDEPKGEFDRLTHGIGEALWSRSKAIRAVRSLFDEERFLEVDTPAIVPSPGLDVHLDAFEVKGARAPAYLITSPEYQMKRLLVGGVPRCFQIARCFRRGELGDRHNPEFVMLEWYRAFADVEAVMLDTERVVRRVATELRDEEAIEIGGVKIDLGKPFERLSVGEAFSRYAGVTPDETIALASSDEERFFRLLVDAVEPALARSTAPIFLVDFPAPFASLARRKPSDPRVCERFELYAGGVELCNGFGELTDPVEQRSRLERDREERRTRGLPVYPIDERFLAALEEGMPPSAGNALGLDRLIALWSGGSASPT